jgi:hypothetical protein
VTNRSSEREARESGCLGHAILLVFRIRSIYRRSSTIKNVREEQTLQISLGQTRVGVLVLAVLALIPLVGRSVRLAEVAPQSRPQSDQDYFFEADKTFLNYSGQFIEMAKPLSGQQADVAWGLQGAAERTHIEVAAAAAMLQIQSQISCESDRTNAGNLTGAQLSQYYNILESEIKQGRHLLALTKIPAVAEVGLRMTDDLQSLRMRLDSARRSLLK